MPLADGQIQITRSGASLLLNQGTPYDVVGFNPWDRGVRADQTGSVPWGDGDWSGAEWRDATMIPLVVEMDRGNWANLMGSYWPLDAALAPVRTGTEGELTWAAGGAEYLMYVRPRGATLQARSLEHGTARVTSSLFCPDPSIYSAVEHVTEIGLLHRIGGLSTPFGLPVGIYSVIAGGEATVFNTGTAPARLLLRITGPLTAPSRITVINGSSVETLNLDTLLGPDDVLDIDTKDKLIVLNGSVPRLADHWGAWPLLPPGESLVRFESDVYESAARLTIRHRDTW